MDRRRVAMTGRAALLRGHPKSEVGRPDCGRGRYRCGARGRPGSIRPGGPAERRRSSSASDLRASIAAACSSRSAATSACSSTFQGSSLSRASAARHSARIVSTVRSIRVVPPLTVGLGPQILPRDLKHRTNPEALHGSRLQRADSELSSRSGRGHRRGAGLTSPSQAAWAPRHLSCALPCRSSPSSTPSLTPDSGPIGRRSRSAGR